MHILSDCAHVGRCAQAGGKECKTVEDRGWHFSGRAAERMGVDRAYVSGLELGQRNPTVVTLWHLGQALARSWQTAEMPKASRCADDLA